jgi:hypothetical protein
MNAVGKKFDTKKEAGIHELKCKKNKKNENAKDKAIFKKIKNKNILRYIIFLVQKKL